MLIAAIVLAAAGVAGADASAQSKEPGGGGIVYGNGLGAVVTAPHGWVFDSTSGVDQGLHAVMYPEGSTWAKAGEVIYLQFGRLEPGQALTAFIAADIATHRKESPSLVTEVAEAITLGSGTKAEVRLFSGAAMEIREAVAYATQDTGVAIFVLSCLTEKSFRESLPAFREVVAGSSLLRVEVQQ